MSSFKKAGQRVGDWFLWIECEIAKTDNYRRIPLVTLRKAVSGGDIISTVVASKEMAAEFRNAAQNIETMIASLEGDCHSAAEN